MAATRRCVCGGLVTETPDAIGRPWRCDRCTRGAVNLASWDRAVMVEREGRIGFPGPGESYGEPVPERRHATNRERVAKHAAARQAAGGRRVTVWLTAEAAAALDRLTAGGFPSVTTAVCSALESWDAIVREANARMDDADKPSE